MAKIFQNCSNYSKTLNGAFFSSPRPLALNSISSPFGNIFSREIKKHWDPKFKKLRGLKMIKVKLPDYEKYNKADDEINREELKAQMKERGVLPDRPWIEKPIYISCTGGVFEAYVPPEGDGKVSAITAQGAKQKLEFLEKKSKSMLALRKIRQYEEDFEFADFLKEAQEIYVNAHSAMTSKDRDKIIAYVTERAYPEVASNIGDKTMKWEFLQSIEPPRVAHVRCTEIVTKINLFSQITVRFHTQQKLAIYDRFGRLLYGSETLPKDVLEYVVFEKHITNKFGRWRIHDKIIPDWMPSRAAPLRTHVIPSDLEPEPEPEVETASVVSAENSPVTATQPA